MSDAAKYVVVGLSYFGIVAASVWSKQEFNHIFFDFFMRSETAVLRHGRGDADIIGSSCGGKRFVPIGHCRWEAAVIEGSTRAMGTISYRLQDGLRGLQNSMI